MQPPTQRSAQRVSRQLAFRVGQVFGLLGVFCGAVMSAEAADADKLFETEPAKKVPVLYDVDVVVAGGGTSGTFAALAAARHGAKTVVIDRFGRVGGNMGPGMWAGGSLHLVYNNKDAMLNKVGLGGIPEEFIERVIFTRAGADRIPEEKRLELKSKHFNVPGYRLGSSGHMPVKTPGYVVESYVVSHTVFEMMEEAGVEMLLSSYVSDPIMDGNTVKGVYVETKSGRVAVRAKVVIDATGEADIATRAGASVSRVGHPSAGMHFLIGGVDGAKFLEWADGDYRRGGPNMKQAINEAVAAGELIYPRRVGDAKVSISRFDMAGPDWDTSAGPHLLSGRTGTSGGYDFADAKTVSLMEKAHRMLVFEHVQFMRKYAPGFENAYLFVTAPYLGARGGRFLDSVQPITRNDVLASRRFDDVIYLYWNERGSEDCDLPYRMLLPKNIDGLIACGRSSVRYGPNFRQRYSMLQNGQAAGVAAALAAADGVEPRNVDVKKLQRALLALGCFLGDEARIEELGLK